MNRIIALVILLSANAYSQVGSVSTPCIWSGSVADCLPDSGVLLRNQRDLRLGEATANGSNYAAIQAPSTLAADYTLTLPADDGDADEVCTTNGSGTLDFAKIVNANVDSAAAIDGSKIVSATGSVSGVVTTSAQTFAGDKNFRGNTPILTLESTDTTITTGDAIANLKVTSADTSNTSGVALNIAVKGASATGSSTSFDIKQALSGTETTIASTDSSGIFDFNKGAKIAAYATDTPAASGYVGEIESESLSLASKNQLASTTAENLVGTTLGLGAGQWRISGVVAFLGDSGAALTQINVSLSNTTGTMAGTAVPSQSTGQIWIQRQLNVTVGTNEEAITIPSYDVLIASSSTLYVVVRAQFTGVVYAYGYVQAVRIR